MTLSEKAAYLRGLADGMKLNDGTDTGKVLVSVIDLLNDIAVNVDDIAESQTALGDEVDEISADLTMLETKVEDVLGEGEDPCYDCWMNELDATDEQSPEQDDDKE